MNFLNIKFFLSPPKSKLIYRPTTQPPYLYDMLTCSPSKLHVILDPHLSSHLLAYQLAPPTLKITHHLTSSINFLTHFVSHARLDLPLP